MNRFYRVLFAACLVAGAIASWSRIVGDRVLGREAPPWLGAREAVRDAVDLPADGGYAFYVLGDVQQGLGAFRKALALVSADPEARFAVMVGDLVTTGGGARYRALFDAAAREGCRVPVLTVPGNHDRIEDYEALLGPHAWTSRAGPDLLVGIDNSRLSDPSDEAIDELERTLGRSDARNRFVFLHRPILRDETPRRRIGHLREVLERGGVSWVFAGHLHRFEVRSDGKLSEAVNGCGGDMSGPFPTPAYTARVRVSGPVVSVEMIGLGSTWEVDALLVSTFVVHWYAPWREAGRWWWATGLLLLLTLFSGGVGYGPRVLLPGLAFAVTPLWPLAGIAVAAVAVCSIGAMLLLPRRSG